MANEFTTDNNNVNGTRSFGGNNWITVSDTYTTPELRNDKNINFDFQKVLKDDTKQVQEEAIDNVVSGAPLVEEPLHLAANPIEKTTLNNHGATTGFTVRDEMMSKLHMMDEDGNYTDTYTNYINKGGAPLPGYEQEHTQLLAQERYESIFQKVDTGELSYETALMQAYGSDILDQMGYHVKSVGWWMSKYLSHDYSNPADNRYLMDQVLSYAEEYHKSRMTGDWAHSNASKTATVTSLIGDELTAKQIKDIFGDIDKYAEDQRLKDGELLKQVNAGIIPATARIVQIDDTTWGYLHTDGKLHKLTKGEQIKFNEDGSLKEISLNGNDALDFIDHFGSSFMGVFRGLGKLATILTAARGLWNGEGYVSQLTSDITSIDAALNDLDWNVIGRADHIDLDGFNWEAKDIFMALGDISGMVAGSATLAWAAGGLNTVGQNMMANSTSFAGKAAGWGMRSVGRLGLRSTGWYAGVEDASKFSLPVIGKVASGTSAHWLNTAFKVTPVLAAKDFYNTVGQLNQINIQAQLNGKENVFSDQDILEKAGKVTMMSWVTNILFSSNVDSSFTERWGPLVKSKEFNALRRVDDITLQAAQAEIEKGMTFAPFKELMTRESNLIKLDNIVDYFNTLAGNQYQNYVTTTKTVDGKQQSVSFQEYISGYTNTDASGNETKVSGILERPEFWKDVVTTGVMQFKEYQKDKRRMLNGYNTAIQGLRTANTEWLAALDADIAKTKDETSKSSLQLVKDSYLRILNDPKDSSSYEARIVKAMDYVCTKLGKLPEKLENSVLKGMNAEKAQFYKESYNYMVMKMDAQDAYYAEFYSKASTENGWLRNKFSQFIAGTKNKFRGMNAQDLASKQYAIDNSKQLAYNTQTNTIDTRANIAKQSTAYDAYLKMTDLADVVQERDNAGISPEAFEYANAMEVKHFNKVNNKTKKEIKDYLAENNINLPAEGFVVYRMKEEAGYSDSEFNDRMKQNVNRTTMEILGPDYGLFKVNDNLYIMSTLNSGAGQILTFESQCNINSGLWKIRNDDPITGAKLILGTLMGSNGFKEYASNKDVYDTLNNVFDLAIQNKVLTELDVADALHIMASYETDLPEAQKIQKAIIKHMDSLDTSDFKKLNSIDKYYKTYEAITAAKAYTGKNKIAKNSKLENAVNLLINKVNANNEIELTNDAYDIMDKFKRTGRWSGEDEAKFKKAITEEKEGSKFLPAVRDTLDAILKESESAVPGSKKNTEIAKILLPEDATKKEIKNLTGVLEAGVNKLEKVTNRIKQYKVSGDIVTIDLNALAGEYTMEAKKDIDSKSRMKAEGVHIELKDSYYGLADEYRGRMNIAKENGSTLLVFDLNNQQDIDNYNAIAKRLKLFGNKEFEITTKAQVQDSINELENGWDDVVQYNNGTKQYVSFGADLENKMLKLKNPDISKVQTESKVLYEDGRVEDYDVPKQLAAKVHMYKTSKRIKKIHSTKQTIMPIGAKNSSEDIIGYEEDTGLYSVKAGTAASNITGKEATQQIMDYADGYTKDNNTGTYFYLRNMIDKANPSEFQFSYYGYDETFKTKLEKAEIIGDKGFYEIVPNTPEGTITIKLKDNQKENMINYLDSSKNFNLFRILPLISKDSMGKSNYVWAQASDGIVKYVDNNGVAQEAHIPDMYHGNDVPQSTGIQVVFNVSVGFDDNSTLKAKILGGLLKANDTSNADGSDYFFDPFYGEKKVMSAKHSKAILKAYYNDDLKTLEKYANSDYEAAYLAGIVKLSQDYTTDDTSEDWKVLYEDPQISRRLLKAKQNGEDISSSNTKLVNEITQEYKDYYKVHNAQSYSTPESIEYSYGSIPYRATHTVGDNMYANAQILKGAAYDNYLLDIDNISVKDLETVVKQAIDNFGNISTDTTMRGMMNIPNSITVFEESPVLRVIQGLEGNDNHLSIADCEEVANLTDEQLNLLAEVYNDQMTYNDWNKLRSQAKSIIDDFDKLLPELDRPVREWRNPSDLVSPSKSVTAEKMISDNGIVNDFQKKMLLQDQRKSDRDRTYKLADEYADDLNDRYDELVSKYPDIFSRIRVNQDSEARHRFFSPHTAEVLQMENIFAREQAADILNKTMTNVSSTFNTDDTVSAKITRDMYYSAMDTTPNTEWQQLKVYDSNGNELLQTGFDGRNYMEIYAKLSQLEKENKLDKAFFVQLEKHAIDTYDPINFNYTELQEDSIKQIKNYYLVNAFEQYMKSKDSWRGKDVDDFVNHLKTLQRDNIETYNEVISDITTTQLSKEAYRKAVIQNVQEVFNNKYSAEKVFNYLVPQIIGRPTYNNEGINNYVNGALSSLDSDNPAERAQAALTVFGRDYSVMDDKEKELLQTQAANILTDIKLFTKETSEYTQNRLLNDIEKLAKYNYDSISYKEQFRHILDNYTDIDPRSFLKAYIAYATTPEAITYKTSGVSLDQLKNSDTFLDTKLNITADGAKQKMSLLEFRHRMQDMPDGYSVVNMDLEGLIPDKDGPANTIKSTKTLYDIFQAHMNIQTKEGIKEITYYITHDKSPEQWVRDNNILENSYYKTEEGYKNAVDEYLTGKPSDTIQFVTEEEFKTMLSKMENTTFIAYNGDTYDFNYINPFIKGKNNVTLDATEFDSMLYTGDDLTRRIQRMIIGKDLGETFVQEAHNAKADTQAMKQWIEYKMDSFVDPTIKAKTKMLSVIDGILNQFNVQEDARNLIYNEMDDAIGSSAKNINADLYFVQGMPDASATAYLTRMLNNLRETNLGYSLYQLKNNPDLWKATGFTELKPYIQDGSLEKKVIDLTTEVMVNNPGLTPEQALSKVYWTSKNELQENLENKNDFVSFNDVVKNIIDTDPLIDTDTEDFKEKRQIIINNLGKNNENSISSLEDRDLVKHHYNAQKFNIYAEDLVNENMGTQSFMIDDLKNSILEDATTALSSSVDGKEQFNQPLKIIINSPTAEKLAQQAEQYTDLKGYISFSRFGSYKRIHSISPTGLPSDFVPLEFNAQQNKLVRSKEPAIVETNTIFVDRKALEDMSAFDYKNLFDEDGNVYIATHRQPSADKHQINYFKVKVVEGNNGDIYATPMVWRSIFAGDFDGDATTQYIITDPFERAIAKFKSEETFLAHDIQEQLYSELVHNKKPNGNDSIGAIALAMSKDSDIIAISKKIDFNLKRNNEQALQENLDTLRDLVERKMPEYEAIGISTDEILKVIGVQESNGHRYIRNFDVLNDPKSYSYEETFKEIADKASIKTNLSDSLFGFKKQRFMSNPVEIENLGENALAQLNLSPVRMTPELIDEIDSKVWTEQDLNDYFGTVNKIILNFESSHDLSSDTKKYLTDSLVPYIKSLAADINSLKDKEAIKTNILANTQFIFNTLEDTIKFDSEMNKKLSNIFADKSLPLSTEYSDSLKKRKQLLGDIKNIKGFGNYIRGGTSLSNSEDSFLINKILQQSYKDKSVQFKDMLDEELQGHNMNVAVLDRDPNGDPDTIYINSKSTKRFIGDVQQIDLKKVLGTSEYSDIQDRIVNILRARKNKDKLIDQFSPDNLIQYKKELQKEIDKAQDMYTLTHKLSNDDSQALEDLKNTKRDVNRKIKQFSKITNMFFDNNGVRKATLISQNGRIFKVNFETLDGKKGFDLGKGMIQKVKVINSDADWDIAIPAHALKADRINKLGYHVVFSDVDKTPASITMKTKSGIQETFSARIFKDSPFYLLENFNRTQSGKMQKVDLMSILALQGSPEELGMLGDAVITRNDDGTVSYTNAGIIEPIEMENNSKNIYWSNTAGNELKLRAVGLGNIIETDNLWGQYNTWAKKEFGVSTGINNVKDYQETIAQDYNPTSLKMYSAVQGTLEFLLKSGYTYDDILERLTPHQRKAFSEEVENLLTQYEQGNVKDYNGIRVFSKSKARSDLANRCASFVGKVVNPGEKSARQNASISSEEYFYIPYNKSFEIHNGYALNHTDAMQATAEGYLGYGSHYNGEQGLGFRPLNKKYAMIYPTNLSDDNVFNDMKQGHVGQLDENVVLPTKGQVFKKQQKGYYVDNNIDIPKGTYYQNLAKTTANELTRVSGDKKLGVLITSLATKDNIVDSIIDASPRNISPELVFNAYAQKYSLEDNPVLTVKPLTRTGSYKQLTDKGNDLMTGTMNYYTYKDIYNKVDNPNINLKNVDTSIKENIEDNQDLIDAYNIVQKAFEDNSKATKQFTTKYNLSNITDSFDINFTYGKDEVDVFKNSWFSSSGIHIGKEDKGDTINVSMALEKAYGDAQAIQAQGDQILYDLRKAIRGTTDRQFQDYCTYMALSNAELHGEDITNRLTYIGVNRDYFNTTMKQNYELLKNNPEINTAMNNLIDYRLKTNNRLSEIYGEPSNNLMMFLTPYTPTKNKELAYGTIKSALKATLDYNGYDYLTKDGKIKENMMFNFFEANKVMNRETAKLIANQNLSNTLHTRGLLDNVETFNNINKYLSDGFDMSKFKPSKEDRENGTVKQINETLISLIQQNTDLDTFMITKGSKNSVEKLQLLWGALNSATNEALDNLPENINKDYTSLKYLSGKQIDRALEPDVKNAVNLMETRIIMAQRIMELSKDVATNISDYLNSCYKQGYTFVNKWGQKLSKDSYVTPIGDSSMKWIQDNIEIAANNQSETKWNQFLVEKAIRGELYLMKSDLADQLEEKYFTTKVPSKMMATLKKISTSSAGIQMAMPAKMLGRLFRFTGTDYMLGSTYSPKVWENVPRAAKELSAAIYSKGGTIEEGSLLEQYLRWEGQPLNVSGKDPVTFTEDMSSSISNLTDKLTQPLAYQNHFGRYAIWLTAYEAFEKGDPIYGPAYYLKDQIDNLTKIDPETGEVIPDNAAKATFVMDYMIGSPGGFPYLSKKTNGLMMYATFPMNLTRTAGAYAMSVGRLFQEGFTSENAPRWARTIAAPSCTALVAAYFGNLLISYVCDKYGVSEEEEEKWKREGVTIDPLGTILGGTPSVVYDSMNPIYQLKEMYANPFINEYNKTFGDKALGFLNKNFLSKLNPAIKYPTEVLLQKDFMGDSLQDTSKAYNMYENGIRKVLGFLVGSGVANSIVDQNQIDQYSEDSNFLNSLWKGLAKGFSGDLGNQKSWKKDTSNYYAVLNSIKSYNSVKYAEQGYGAEYEDLLDATYLKTKRNATGKYGSVNQDDYTRVNKMLKKMIQKQEDPTTIYTYIASEYNKGTSEATLRKALNNNSLIRKLDQVNKSEYYKTLSDRDLINLEKALKWEEETYPLLKAFFPNNTDNYYKTHKAPYYKTPYISSYSSTPRTYYPRTNYNNSYYKKKTYYNNYSNNYKFDNNTKVSPQMGIWDNNYNKIEDLKVPDLGGGN